MSDVHFRALLPEIMTPQDVANAIALPEARVVELLERGDLPGARVDGAWRILRVALLRALEPQRGASILNLVRDEDAEGRRP